MVVFVERTGYAVEMGAIAQITAPEYENRTGHKMKVELGRFARVGIESHYGRDLDAGVRAALVHYTRRLRSGRRPVALPGFRGAGSSADSAMALELQVDPSVAAALQHEVHRHGVSVEELTAHAILVYLADLDEAGIQNHGASGAPALH